MSSVYFIRCKATGFVKIGISRNPWKRLSKMQSDCPGELEILGCEPGGVVRECELHLRFAAERVRGEWFRASSDLLAYARSLPVPASPRKVYDIASSPTLLAAAVGIAKGHASSFLTGKREPNVPMALRIYDAANIKLGVLAKLTAAEIETLRGIYSRMARAA